jgi:vacuolar protein 8
MSSWQNGVPADPPPPPTHRDELLQDAITAVREGPSLGTQAQLTAALNKLALSDGGKGTNAQASGVLALVKLAKEGAEKMKARAATALMTLAADDENKVTIAKAGGIQVLLNLVESDNNEAAEQAAGALLILVHDERNQVIMSKAEGATILVHLVKEGSAVAKERAAGLLAIIANKDDNLVLIAKAGGVAALVSLLGAGVTVAAQERAAVLLMHLACDESNDSAMKEFGAVAPLVKLLRIGSIPAKELAAAALLNLAEADDEIRSAIAHEGGVDALLRLLVEGRAASKEQAIGALVVLATNAEVRAVMVGKLASVSSTQIDEIQQADARANGSGEGDDTDAYMGGIVKLLSEGAATAGGGMEQSAALLCLLSRSATDRSEEGVKEEGDGRTGADWSAALVRAGGIVALVGTIGCRGKRQRQRQGQGQGRGSLDGGDGAFSALTSTAECVTHACGALFSLSASSDATREAIRRAGGVKALVAIVGGRAWPQDTSQEPAQDAADADPGAAALAAALSLAPGVVKKPIGEKSSTASGWEGVVPVVTVAREQATGALANLCAGGATDAKAAVGAAGGVEVLLQVTREAMQVEEARRKEGSGRGRGVGAATTAEAAACIATAAAAKANAAGGLCNLASDEACAQRLVDADGAVQLLVDLASGGGRDSDGGIVSAGDVDADVATAVEDGTEAVAVAAAKIVAEDAKEALSRLARSTKHRLEIQRLGGGAFLGNMLV